MVNNMIRGFVGIIGVGLLLLIILLPMSVKIVKPNQYGVVYDSLWRKFDKKILGQGRHVLEPTSTIIIFPSVYEPIDFTSDSTDIDCISRDGLIVKIDAVSQYRYIEKELINTLYLYGDTMDEFMKDLARSVFNNVCTNYEIESGFIDARQNISNSMLKSFQDAIVNIGVPSSTQFAELRGYQYSVEYKNAITEKQAAAQQIDLLLSQRNVAITNAQTNLSNYEQMAEINLQQAETTVLTIMTQAQAESNAILTRWMQYADGFTQTMNQLNMKADEFVEKYISIAHLDDPNNPNLVYVTM
jgi:regulator of protease activity HflC (stomatin/prohibitin superfamily)